MSILDGFSTLSPSLRQSFIDGAGVADAVAALGREAGIEWLETNIQPQVSSGWGSALYALQPFWDDLDRWIHLSKPHGLAAIDALLDFAIVDVGPFLIRATRREQGEKPQLPAGADPQKIHAALDYAIAT